MIRVPGDDPTTVSFIQKGVEANNGRIASEQVTKAAAAEVVARTAFENANYRLEKATETLKASEIAYQEAVAKSAWNKEQVRAVYNNALAGFRDADRNAEIAAEQFSLAKAALGGLRSVAKAGISNGNELKAAVKLAKTPEEKKACVDAAEKLKLVFFLPKGWKAEADKMVAKSSFTSAERASFVEAERKALSIKDKQPHIALEILNNVADAYAIEAGDAKQKGDLATFQRLAAEGGRVRGLATQIRQEGFDNKYPVQDVKDITNLPLEVVGKTATTNITKEVIMPDAKILVVCPSCGGDGPASCEMCGGEKMVPEAAYHAAWGNSDYDDEPGMAFTTKSLLTRDFQKSVGYQNYIFTKGGPGSGEGPGHPFRGNQWTGGQSAGGRLIHEREGHKVTMKRYEEGAAAHKAAAEAQKAIARGHESQGRHAKAAEAHRAAAEHHKAAAGFHEGIAGIHQKVHGDETARSEHRGEAAKQRVYQGRSTAEAARLEALAA